MSSSPIQFQQIYRMLFLSLIPSPLCVLWKTQGPPIPNSSASSADSDASAASSSSAKASVGLDDKSRFTNLDRSPVEGSTARSGVS